MSIFGDSTDKRTEILAVEIVSMSARRTLEVLDARYGRESLYLEAFLKSTRYQKCEVEDVQRKGASVGKWLTSYQRIVV